MLSVADVQARFLHGSVSEQRSHRPARGPMPACLRTGRSLRVLRPEQCSTALPAILRYRNRRPAPGSRAAIRFDQVSRELSLRYRTTSADRNRARACFTRQLRNLFRSTSSYSGYGLLTFTVRINRATRRRPALPPQSRSLARAGREPLPPRWCPLDRADETICVAARRCSENGSCRSCRW